MPATPALPESQRKVLCDVLDVLARTFWGPTAHLCQQMLQGAWLHPFEILAPALHSDPPDVIDRVRAIFNPFSNGDALFQYLEEGYLRLCINARTGIAAPLYASCYEGDAALLMGKSTLAVKDRFESAGLAVDESLGEPPDHLSIELEFLYFLLQRHEDTGRDSVGEAAAFASEAVLPWVRQFSARLADERRCRFYPLASALLVAVLELISNIDKFAKSPSAGKRVR